MKRIEVHPSVYLAWNIANAEACLSGDPRIEPVHFLLATLIIIDGMFEDVADSMKLSSETMREVFDCAAECRSILEMSDDEITNARRAVRRTLREAKTPMEMIALHRSGESRFMFQRAGRRTLEAGAARLTIVHLFEEILEHLPTDAQAFLKSPVRRATKEIDEWPDYIVDDSRD